MAAETKIPKTVESNGGSTFDEQEETLQIIDTVQNDIDDINQKVSDEIVKVEQKYSKLREPLYLKRAKFIEQIPNFWSTVMLNHPQLNALISESDEEILQLLRSIEVEEEDYLKRGFKIHFTFEPNKYFVSERLTKDQTFDANGERKDAKIASIWKPGMKPQSNQHKIGDKRGLVEDSFFDWFEDPDPGSDELSDIFKEDIWSNPLQYFMGTDSGEYNEESEDGVYEGEYNEDESCEEVESE